MNKTTKAMNVIGSAVNARPFEYNPSGVSYSLMLNGKKTSLSSHIDYGMGTRADPNTPTEIERMAKENPHRMF